MRRVPSVPPWHHVTASPRPQIWCLGNESRFHINQSVEGTVLATVLRGLVPGVPYRAEVAAATGAGVGARSAPVPIRIGESLVAAAPAGGGVAGATPVLGTAPRHPCRCFSPFPTLFAAPPAERDAGPAGGSSVAERLAEVARQPAFIAGVGGACWVILAAFAAWLYGRRRRKKELSHFTGTGEGASPGTPPPPPTLAPITPPATHRLSLYSILRLYAHR